MAFFSPMFGCTKVKVKTIASVNQMAVQTSASWNRTTCARRWNTPRSSESNSRTTTMNPTQWIGVISISASMPKGPIGCLANSCSVRDTTLDAGCRGVVHDHLRAGFGTLALVPPENQGAGDVDAGIGSGDDANKEREGEIVDHPAAEDVERHGCEEHGARGDDRAAQGLVERLVDQFLECAPRAQLQVFTDAVEDDNGIVDGKADDCQDRGDHGGVELAPRKAIGQTVATDCHEDVVDHRHDRADGKGELVAKRHVKQDAQEREQRRDNGRLLDFAADRGADMVGPQHGEPGVREALVQCVLNFLRRPARSGHAQRLETAAEVLLILDERFLLANRDERRPQLLDLNFLLEAERRRVASLEINAE